jgi:S1-C subfamily serine protease
MMDQKTSPTNNNVKSLFVLFLLFLLLVSSFNITRNWSIGQFNFGLDSLQQWFRSNPNPTKTPEMGTVTVVEEESAVIDIVEKSSPSVVSVIEKSITFDFFSGPHAIEASIGTGFAIEENLIVTNKHVVSEESSTYTVVDVEGNRLDVSQIYRDPLNDLALLRVENGKFVALSFGDSDSLKIGQTAVAIGNALGKFSNTVTKGVISGKGRGITTSGSLGAYQEELENVIQTDAALNPGNSGGPLINIAGQVIGVNVAVGVETENIGFAIPSNTVRELVSDFNAGVERKRPYLGVRYSMITKQLAENSDYPVGAMVREVVGNGPASKAGIKANDVIVALGGQPIDDNNLLSSVINRHKVGDKLDVKVWRNESEINISVTLEALPEE